ncbi:hypothetical protein R1flu_001787 [Riccia fluitans]|uniref:acid phosphatase n=1 Tax=Riccia fluitans TaxID=41844 RepID=A0ABD1Y4C5_9MARC
MAAKVDPYAVLFVCLGNICRSPSAEAVFINAVKKRGMEANFKIDSAGTINYHEGNPADSRMRAAALRRGVKIESISRPVRPSDFKEFDIILAMDKQNREDLYRLHRGWKSKTELPDLAPNKIQMMCDYCRSHDTKEVPDPYYGGPEGFEEVLNLLEDACEGLLDSLLAKKA